MKHHRILSSVILAGVISSGTLFTSAAEQSDVTLTIISIEELSEAEAQPEPVTEAQTEPVTEAQTEPATEAQTEPVTEAQTEPVTETQTKPETETQTEPVTETELQTEPVTETQTEPVTEAQTEPVTETELQTEPETEVQTYEITSALDADYVLDIRHCTVHDNDSQIPQLYHSLDVDQQKFYFEPLQDGLSRICVLHTGDALTAFPEDHSVRMLPAKSQQDNDASDAQAWSAEKARYGYCYIKNEAGQYLTLGSFRPYAGASLILDDLTGGINQMWKLKPSKSSGETCADTDLVNPYGEDGPYADLRLTLLFGTTPETISADDLARQITENENHQLTLNPEYLSSFVEKLAAKYDTQGQPIRFRTSLGKELTLHDGDFGWKLDTEETTGLLSEFLETNQIKFLTPVWAHAGWSFEDDGGIGDSYVEVDLTRQKVFLYKSGKKLLETDCVSGTESDPERSTPDGVYNIYYMNSPDTLDGPGYSEDVTYWMPFYLGYGLHDATWRDEFGGDIYKTDGSHGCINLPLEAAGLIYKTVGIGYPVVLYR